MRACFLEVEREAIRQRKSPYGRPDVVPSVLWRFLEIARWPTPIYTSKHLLPRRYVSVRLRQVTARNGWARALHWGA